MSPVSIVDVITKSRGVNDSKLELEPLLLKFWGKKEEKEKEKEKEKRKKKKRLTS